MRPSTWAAAIVLPLPMKLSNTISPASENAFRKNSTSARGNGAECDPWPDSAATSITLLGRASPLCWLLRLPLPNKPLPLSDLGLSGEYSKTSSDGALTASGLNLIDEDFAKWKTGSQAFLNLFGHPPGTPLRVLRQQNSSTNSQPHWRLCASTKSFT